RTIPLHSHLKDIVTARVKGKAKDDRLFHEPKKRERRQGKSYTMAFNRHRTKVGVDAKVDGKRRSLTNFHSWRRWTATRLKEEDVTRDVRNMIMGWSSPDMADRYAVGADLMRQMREALERVKLPIAVPLL